jgi:hypothetical protein
MAPIMIHDFAITPSLSVIFDLPLTVRIEKAFLDRIRGCGRACK